MLIIECVLAHNGEKTYIPYEHIELFGPNKEGTQGYWMIVAGETYSLRGCVEDVLRQVPNDVPHE